MRLRGLVEVTEDVGAQCASGAFHVRAGPYRLRAPWSWDRGADADESPASKIAEPCSGLVIMDRRVSASTSLATAAGSIMAALARGHRHHLIAAERGRAGAGAGRGAEPARRVPAGAARGKAGEGFALSSEAPKSVGRVRAFYGNFGMLVRAYAYILSLGGDGMKRMTAMAILNANYIRQVPRRGARPPFSGAVPPRVRVLGRDPRAARR